MRRGLATVLFSALALPTGASADDGAYGRLATDLTLEAGLGGGVAFEGDEVLGAATVELRARYVHSVGLVLGGEGRVDGTSRLWIGADVRPLFLGRFLMNASFRDRYWDLFLDSIGIDLGVAFLPLDDRIGAALAIGFGVDVPIAFFGESFEGIALRLAGRHVAALPTDRAAPDGGANDWIAMAAIVIRGSAVTGLTSWERRRYELPDP